MNRKDFLKGFGRIALLGSLALVSGILVSRRQVRLQRECGLEIACKDCRKRRECEFAEDEKG